MALKSFKLTENFKNKILITIQSICLILLVFNGLQMTTDYMRFDYLYKMDVLDNDLGYEFPGITICTESQILFDRLKILKYFNATKEYSDYVLYKSHILDKWYYKHFLLKEWTIKKNKDMNKFYIPFEKRISNELDLNEKFDLIVRANDLFSCWAEIDYKNETNSIRIDNCFDRE